MEVASSDDDTLPSGEEALGGEDGGIEEERGLCDFFIMADGWDAVDPIVVSSGPEFRGDPAGDGAEGDGYNGAASVLGRKRKWEDRTLYVSYGGEGEGPPSRHVAPDCQSLVIEVAALSLVGVEGEGPIPLSPGRSMGLGVVLAAVGEESPSSKHMGQNVHPEWLLHLCRHRNGDSVTNSPASEAGVSPTPPDMRWGGLGEVAESGRAEARAVGEATPLLVGGSCSGAGSRMGVNLGEEVSAEGSDYGSWGEPDLQDYSDLEFWGKTDPSTWEGYCCCPQTEKDEWHERGNDGYILPFISLKDRAALALAAAAGAEQVGPRGGEVAGEGAGLALEDNRGEGEDEQEGPDGEAPLPMG